MKRLTSLLSIISLSLLWGCSSPEADDTLKIGMELSYPPFETTDEANNPIGISVDIAHALGDYLGRPVKIENIAFAGLISSLKTGKIDLIVSSMTVTEERKQSIDFSDPYLTTGLCLLVAKDSGILSIEDLDQKEKSIAVKQGTTGHLFAMDHFKNASVLALEKETSAVIEVTQGKADAFIYDQISTLRNWQRHKETTRPILAPFRSEDWAIGLKKGDDDLREQVNAFLKAFKADGGFDRLGSKYLADEKKGFEELGIEFLF